MTEWRGACMLRVSRCFAAQGEVVRLTELVDVLQHEVIFMLSHERAWFVCCERACMYLRIHTCIGTEVRREHVRVHEYIIRTFCVVFWPTPSVPSVLLYLHVCCCTNISAPLLFPPTTYDFLRLPTISSNYL
jgi:hypothetical protein